MVIPQRFMNMNAFGRAINETCVYVIPYNASAVNERMND